MLLKNYLVFIPGIILAFVLYTLSQGFNNIIGIELLGYEKSPISTAMIAIILGIILGNIFNVGDTFQKGEPAKASNLHPRHQNRGSDKCGYSSARLYALGDSAQTVWAGNFIRTGV